MLLSVRQYAILFGMLIAILVSVFAYEINLNLQSTSQKIEDSQLASAKIELEQAAIYTLSKVRESADKLSQWEEVKQQINNPDIFSYWYILRFKKFIFDLQKYTVDLMIYDVNGKALGVIDGNTLAQEIDTRDIDKFSFHIINQTDIVYMLPVYSDGENGTILGYLGARLQLLPLLRSISALQYVAQDTLFINAPKSGPLIDTLMPENFSYDLQKSQEMMILEDELSQSIIELVLIIVIPSILLYITLVYIISVPVNNINSYINRLRTNPEDINDDNYGGFFQVAELKKVYESLIKYHTELSQKEEHLSLTLNSIGDAVITTDSENRIVRMNPVAEQLTGWSFAEAEGKPVSQVFNILDSSSKEKLNSSFNSVIDAGEIIHLSKDTILHSKDERKYHISNSVAPIRDGAGNIRGMVLVFNDITEQKMKDEQLQQSLKMDALGKLTGGIAHDFNNLLGVILGYSELLTRLLNDQAKPLRYANKIHEAGERARKLTARLLTFSRKQTPVSTVTDVNQLIAAEKDMLEQALTARVELKFQLEDKPWPVYLDQGQLGDSILNISINAMHAMPEGGRLTLSTKNVRIDNSDSQYIDLEAGDYLQLVIADTGIGMDQDTSRKIFDPFFTTKGDDGTGLGMSQVYGFVKQSGGTIHVNSELGFGTKITIFLPRYHDGKNVSDDKQDFNLQGSEDTACNETILVVDDEPALLELSCNLLSMNGYHVLDASSGDMALKILENQSADLLLSDVIMPGMDGYQLAAIVTEKYPHMKIQMVSGFSDDRNKKGDFNELHEQLLHKPYSSAELLKRVRRAING